MLRVGLTGGIGSGKTYVAEIFKRLGVPVYSADVEVKRFYDESSELLDRLRQVFGSRIFVDAKLSKKALASIVFADNEALGKLNGIVHPMLQIHFAAWCTEYAAAAYVMIEAAILFESGFHNFVDRVVVVNAPKNIRIQRVMSRDTLAEAEVLARMQHQLSEQELLSRADFVVDASGENPLLPQLLSIHHQLLEEAMLS